MDSELIKKYIENQGLKMVDGLDISFLVAIIILSYGNPIMR